MSRSSRQRPASEGWCGTPPHSVSLVVAAAVCEEDEVLELVAAVRARFGAMRCFRISSGRRGAPSLLCLLAIAVGRSVTHLFTTLALKPPRRLCSVVYKPTRRSGSLEAPYSEREREILK